MSLLNKSIFFSFIVLLICACGIDEPTVVGKTAEEIRLANERDIQNWINNNPNEDVQTTASGLRYVLGEEGNGVRPTLTDTVSIDFDLFLGDGSAFSSTANAGVPSLAIVDELIPGLAEGIQLLSVGGSGVFLIPGPIGFPTSSLPVGINDDDLLIWFVILRDINNQFAGEAERNEIQAYLEANSLTPDTITSSGLNIIHLEEGNGEFPTVSNTVTVHYHGTLLDGTIFDSSKDRGVRATFSLGNVIQGWQEGIPFISKGGKSILIIPTAIAYGANPPASSVIPPNAVLVFEVELFEIE